MIYLLVCLIIWNIILTVVIIKIAKDGYYVGISIPYIKFDREGLWYYNGCNGTCIIKFFWIKD